jgi:mono/diheme cytochrome c family protein
MKYLLTVGIVLFGLGVGAIIFAWSGIYDIAATEPHWGATSSFIGMLRHRSIAVRSEDIQAPDLDDAKLKETGFAHYHEMCRLCHGAPEYRRVEFAEGLYPSPPSMTSGSIQKALSEAKIYWIVKNGIKMTGMPAFGPTHDEKELWGLVAIVEDIPRMSPEQYRQLVIKLTNPGGEKSHGHSHGTMEGQKGS